jgi:hypothetical protein
MATENGQPWSDYPEHKRANPYDSAWDVNAYPFVVRWYVSYPDRLTRWVTRIREFATLEEAVAAYKRPFRGLSIDLMKYNGKPSGQHLDMLARRKATKPTKWSDQVPVELR